MEFDIVNYVLPQISWWVKDKCRENSSVKVLLSNKFVHIFYNRFNCGYRLLGIKLFNFTDKSSLVFYYGVGELVIDFKKQNEEKQNER